MAKHSARQIVLLTDFGQQDGYVGVMKGVISGIAPTVPVIDLSHELPPQDLMAARFVLWNSYRYFPAGTIFVCVVDPGVGSARHILALNTGDHTFIAPDNGLLDYVMAEQRAKHLLRIESPRVMRDDISRTFHGRDIFAPAAAHIAAGFPFTMIGPMHPYTLPADPWVRLDQPSVEARIIYCDHFGNLITNLRLPGDHIAANVQIGPRTLPLSTTYASVAEGELLALRGSHGLLEISVRNGHAAQQLGLGYGEPVLFQGK
jgi:S-adenosyl-L-methionine hydrolase (adenosine-forming)